MPDRASAERERRLDRVVEIVARSGHVGVSDLIRELRMSRGTVQADLRDLEAAGRVQRVWGGARLVDGGGAGDTTAGLDHGDSVSEVAAALVRSGDTVFLACGEFSESIAAALAERTDITALTIITGSLRACVRLVDHLDRFTVSVTGGTLRGRSLAPHDVPPPDRERGGTVDLVFLTCQRIGPSGEVSLTGEQAEMAAAAAAMVAERRILVSSADVFIRSNERQHVALSEFDALITEPTRERAALDTLRARGAQVLIAH